jgi:hypothetical protein
LRNKIAIDFEKTVRNYFTAIAKLTPDLYMKSFVVVCSTNTFVRSYNISL